ncbi:hypothetical protein EZ456_23760 [Pedobacter psychrodurus]|uniref:Uncharacterized protein n=1 Tax=Pedobacter psychrodurus TaxID=2530456 RepID=A0A4R0PJF8_9SPHI|nr:hypothetical protein [Pedobacter psychrodurus]TCD16968.1 hypothetical protein EZ456_23760 [Pedobacter psychrodurus]
MRKLFIIIVLLSSFISSYSQTLTLNQQNSLFNSWMLTKGNSLLKISTQLKSINTKWTLKSEKPEIDGYTKSYYWSAPTEMGEPQYYILTVEEDGESYKFSVRYLFYHLGDFTKMIAEMRVKSKAGEFTDQHDGKKETYTAVVRKPNLDYFLTEQKIRNESGKSNTAFTIDISSKYIDKR